MSYSQDRGKMRGRALLLLAATMALVLTLVVGCGGGGGQPQQQEAAEQRERNPQPQQEEEAEARTIPEQRPGEAHRLLPGRYVTEEFKPALSFRLEGRGWSWAGPETQDSFLIGRLAYPSGLYFMNVEQVYDPNNLKEKVTAPDDMTAWLQNHPRLDAGSPKEVKVGGVSGQQFDVLDTHELTPLFSVNAGYKDKLAIGKGGILRLTILDDVQGETVVIAFECPKEWNGEQLMDEFAPEAQKVLDTVEWEGA